MSLEGFLIPGSDWKKANPNTYFCKHYEFFNVQTNYFGKKMES